jgi:drug/metabolite transporter (DMT)-like permease
MYPIITVALSVAILRERINGLQWLGVCFALLAILLLSAPGK